VSAFVIGVSQKRERERGFRVSEFRVQSSEFRVRGSGFVVQRSAFSVQSSAFRDFRRQAKA